MCSLCTRKLLVSSSDWAETLRLERFTGPKTQRWITNEAALDTEPTGTVGGWEALKEHSLPIIKR